MSWMDTSDDWREHIPERHPTARGCLADLQLNCDWMCPSAGNPPLEPDFDNGVRRRFRLGPRLPMKTCTQDLFKTWSCEMHNLLNGDVELLKEIEFL